MSEDNRVPEGESDPSKSNGDDRSNGMDPLTYDRRLFERYTQMFEADIYCYAGPINRKKTKKVINDVQRRSSEGDRSKNLILYLLTHGGNPHYAYQMMRTLQRHYNQITVFVGGPCKSAGTLIAIGASHIVMTDLGELGPLDMQSSQEDEFFSQTSVLDIQQAVEGLGGHAFNLFLEYTREILWYSGDSVTTKTAASVASQMATDLLKPVSKQIDPLRLGQNQRVKKIASKYGKKLSPGREDVVDHLVNKYPAHGYVIDVNEAKEIFDDCVSEARGPDYRMERILDDVVSREPRAGAVRYIDLDSLKQPKSDESGLFSKNEKESEKREGEQEKPTGNDEENSERGADQKTDGGEEGKEESEDGGEDR